MGINEDTSSITSITLQEQQYPLSSIFGFAYVDSDSDSDYILIDKVLKILSVYLL